MRFLRSVLLSLGQNKLLTQLYRGECPCAGVLVVLLQLLCLYDSTIHPHCANYWYRSWTLHLLRKWNTSFFAWSQVVWDVDVQDNNTFSYLKLLYLLSGVNSAKENFLCTFSKTIMTLVLNCVNLVCRTNDYLQTDSPKPIFTGF